MTDRGSTTHSPRVDEELQHESEALVRGTHEAHAQEWRMQEPPADDEPLPDSRPVIDDIEMRSLLATSLRPSAFPCGRKRLLAVAEEEHAEEAVLSLLRALPSGRTFVNVEAVWEALGGEREVRTHAPLEPEPASVPEPAPASPPAPAAAPQRAAAPPITSVAGVRALAGRATGGAASVMRSGARIGLDTALAVARTVRRVL